MSHCGQPELERDCPKFDRRRGERKIRQHCESLGNRHQNQHRQMSLAAPFDVLFPHQLQVNGFELLPIEINHASAVTTLPFHHCDPFDRILIAQAIEENMNLVSIDAVFDNYSVTRLW